MMPLVSADKVSKVEGYALVCSFSGADYTGVKTDFSWQYLAVSHDSHSNLDCDHRSLTNRVFRHG